jgi:hypothetical protein
MNQPVLDTAAIDFSRAFYDALSRGRTFEQAVTHARHWTIGAHGDSLAWGLPVAAFWTPEKRFDAAWADGASAEGGGPNRRMSSTT